MKKNKKGLKVKLPLYVHPINIPIPQTRRAELTEETEHGLLMTSSSVYDAPVCTGPFRGEPRVCDALGTHKRGYSIPSSDSPPWAAWGTDLRSRLEGRDLWILTPTFHPGPLQGGDVLFL